MCIFLYDLDSVCRFNIKPLRLFNSTTCSVFFLLTEAHSHCTCLDIVHDLTHKTLGRPRRRDDWLVSHSLGVGRCSDLKVGAAARGEKVIVWISSVLFVCLFRSKVSKYATVCNCNYQGMSDDFKFWQILPRIWRPLLHLCTVLCFLQQIFLHSEFNFNHNTLSLWKPWGAWETIFSDDHFSKF